MPDNRYKYSRQEALNRAGNKCEQCEADGDLTAHHIVRVAHAPSLKYYIANLKILCRPCHEIVTKREKDKSRIQHILNNHPRGWLILFDPCETLR